MNTRQQLLDHHEIKAEIGINVLDEILNIFDNSTILLPKKFIVVVENTLHDIRNKAIQKFQEAQVPKAE